MAGYHYSTTGTGAFSSDTGLYGDTFSQTSRYSTRTSQATEEYQSHESRRTSIASGTNSPVTGRQTNITISNTASTNGTAANSGGESSLAIRKTGFTWFYRDAFDQTSDSTHFTKSNTYTWGATFPDVTRTRTSSSSIEVSDTYIARSSWSSDSTSFSWSGLYSTSITESDMSSEKTNRPTEGETKITLVNSYTFATSELSGIKKTFFNLSGLTELESATSTTSGQTNTGISTYQSRTNSTGLNINTSGATVSNATSTDSGETDTSTALPAPTATSQGKTGVFETASTEEITSVKTTTVEEFTRTVIVERLGPKTSDGRLLSTTGEIDDTVTSAISTGTRNTSTVVIDQTLTKTFTTSSLSTAEETYLTAADTGNYIVESHYVNGDWVILKPDSTGGLIGVETNIQPASRFPSTTSYEIIRKPIGMRKITINAFQEGAGSVSLAATGQDTTTFPRTVIDTATVERVTSSVISGFKSSTTTEYTYDVPTEDTDIPAVTYVSSTKPDGAPITNGGPAITTSYESTTVFGEAYPKVSTYKSSDGVPATWMSSVVVTRLASFAVTQSVSARTASSGEVGSDSTISTYISETYEMFTPHELGDYWVEPEFYGRSSDKARIVTASFADRGGMQTGDIAKTEPEWIVNKVTWSLTEETTTKDSAGVERITTVSEIGTGQLGPMESGLRPVHAFPVTETGYNFGKTALTAITKSYISELSGETYRARQRTHLSSYTSTDSDSETVTEWRKRRDTIRYSEEPDGNDLIQLDPVTTFNLLNTIAGGHNVLGQQGFVLGNLGGMITVGAGSNTTEHSFAKVDSAVEMLSTQAIYGIRVGGRPITGNPVVSSLVFPIIANNTP